MNSLANRPLIAISRCLLGDNVRYDAEIKHYPELLNYIQTHFTCIAVCPEVEIGLTVPRPPVQLTVQLTAQLTGSINNIRVTGRDNPGLDITDKMSHYCQQRPLQLNSIHGYIFKSKSPSCGLTDIPVFNSKGQINELSRGVFVNAMLTVYPELPVTDEQGLLNSAQRKLFFQQVVEYQQSGI